MNTFFTNNTFFQPSTPSILDKPPFITLLPRLQILNNRYQELQNTNKPLGLAWTTFIAPPPLIGQQPDSTRFQSYALHRLHYRQDIQNHNLQLLSQKKINLNIRNKKLNDQFLHIHCHYLNQI